MDITLQGGSRTGGLSIPSSKSVAHRLLIAGALSGKSNQIQIDGISDDIKATIKCLDAIFAPADIPNNNPIHLYCGESGTTLRLLLPLAGALGKKVIFHMEGRLPNRPMDEYIDVLENGGMNISKSGNLLMAEGKLQPKDYTICGNISSQYISGLLLSLPLLEAPCTLTVTPPIESVNYIKITEDTLSRSRIEYTCEEYRDKNGIGFRYSILGNAKYDLQAPYIAESDWSNAAFFLCMGAMSDKPITLYALNASSKQGDIAILSLLKAYGAIINTQNRSDGLCDITISRGQLNGIEIDASQIPDLVPVLSVVAAGCTGTTRIYNAARLRLKESDRIISTAAMLRSLGCNVTETDDGLIINGCGYLKGGTVDTYNDHRIAMAAACASIISQSNVLIKDAMCVNKSYPRFFEDFNKLQLI